MSYVMFSVHLVSKFTRARGSVVVKAQCYKPDGRGFETRWQWRKSSGSGVESREYGRKDPSRWPRSTLYPQKIGTNFVDKLWSLGR
jgi:hypothetical protein